MNNFKEIKKYNIFRKNINDNDSKNINMASNIFLKSLEDIKEFLKKN